MIRELKYSLTKDMEPIIEKLNNGYYVSLCAIVDKIHYINSIIFKGVESPFHPIIQPLYCVASAPVEDTSTLPKVSTETVTNILKDSVVVSGRVISEGLTPVIARGFCWDTAPDPIIGGVNTTSNGNGIGAFTNTIIGLGIATTYYIRTYATNSDGTIYGNTLITKTAAIAPILINPSISNIGMTTAKYVATIASNGGSAITASGPCWSTQPTPNINDNKYVTAVTSGTFSSSISGLIPNTTYYIRMYATNSVGTSYSVETNFTTTVSQDITVTITPTLITSGTTFTVVQWFINLSIPAISNFTVSCITTNSTNTGDVVIDVPFYGGQQSSGANTINYTKPAGTSFEAHCILSTLPSGYILGPPAYFTV